MLKSILKVIVSILVIAVATLAVLGTINKEYVYETTLTTTASPQEVFQFATDFSKRPDWISQVNAVEVQDAAAPVVVGSEFVEDTENGKVPLIVTELEPNERLRYNTIDSPTSDLDATWVIEPKAGETEVNISLVFQPKSVLKYLFPALFPLVLKPAFGEDFSTLNTMLDSL